MKALYWISYAMAHPHPDQPEGSAFRGVVVTEADSEQDAVYKAHVRGWAPSVKGMEAVVMNVDSHGWRIPPESRDRLLTRREAEWLAGGPSN